LGKFDIVTVGLDIPCIEKNNYKELNSMSSLSPYDIIIFKSDLDSFNVNYTRFSNGERAISINGYETIKKIKRHWLEELNDALKFNKTIVVITTPNEEIKHATGVSSPRKGEITYNVSLDYLYNNLLSYVPKMRETKGTEFFVCNNDISSHIKQLYNSCKEYTAYEVIFTEIDQYCIPLLKTKSEQVLSFMINYKTGGKLIFWPNIDFEDDNLIIKKEDGVFWTDDAIAISKAFINALIGLHKSLHNSQEQIPDWVLDEKYMLDEEKKICIKIQNNNEKQKRLETDNIKLQEKLQHEQQMKYLLFAQGKELENAVNYALGILGLKVKNYHFKNKDFEIDNLIDYKGSKIVGETEGRDNDAIAFGCTMLVIT